MRLGKGTPLLVALALTLAPVAFGKSARVAAKTPPALPNAMHSMCTTKHEVTGKIESLNAYRMKLSCQMNGKMEDMTFLLDPETQREGKLTVGSTATVKYSLENNQKIASSVTARSSNSTASKVSARKGKT